MPEQRGAQSGPRHHSGSGKPDQVAKLVAGQSPGHHHQPVREVVDDEALLRQSLDRR